MNKKIEQAIFGTSSICPPQIHDTLFNADHKPGKTARFVSSGIDKRHLETAWAVLPVGKIVCDDGEAGR